MLVNGNITSSQFQEAKAQRDLHLKAGRRFTRIREPYFFGYVEDLLQQEYGTNTVRSGGLKVYTTIAPGLQRAATAAITHVLTDPTDPASAVVSIDPRTGAIRAMTAVTPGRKGNQFNFATSARRQPGSTFKVMTLTAAVARGLDPFSVSYLSAPFHYQPDSTCNPSDPNCAWDVQTYEHTYSGNISVANATLASDNTVYARLALDVGPANIVTMAQKLGVRSSLQLPRDAVPSITLGTIGVTPLEEASAYATLAAGGVYSKPMAITRVVLPNGKVDTSAPWGKPQRERVIPDWVAATVTRVLEQNMLYGTGRAAHIYNHTDAGKTGTTDNYADAWFSGYTPQARGDRLDRLSERRDSDAERARDRRFRADVPGADLALVHGHRDRQAPRCPVPARDDASPCGRRGAGSTSTAARTAPHRRPTRRRPPPERRRRRSR